MWLSGAVAVGALKKCVSLLCAAGGGVGGTHGHPVVCWQVLAWLS